jgi:hypothetical protein
VTNLRISGPVNLMEGHDAAFPAIASHMLSTLTIMNGMVGLSYITSSTPYKVQI